MDLVYINAYTKFYQNASICSEDIEEKHILHQSREITLLTLLFMNEFSPFAITNHSFPKSMSTQSLKKIGQKLHKLEPGNEALTDTQTVRRVQHNTRHFFVAGYKKENENGIGV